MIKFVKNLVKNNAFSAQVGRALVDLQNFRRPPTVTPLGFRFTGNEGMMLGHFEKEETEVIRHQLQIADVFLSFGANIGYYCCLALQEGKPTLAVEPMTRNLRCLYQNIALNGWQDRIEVLPLALGAGPGLMEIYGGGTTASLVKGWSGTPEGYRQWIPVSTVDLLLGHRFNGQKLLVLVDVEGAEFALLSGASAFLVRDPQPVWIVEISVDEHLPAGQKVNVNLEKTFQLFWSAGYRAETATSRPREVKPEEIARIAAGGANTLGTHNFIFTPGENC